jgi:hypothetical protein
VRRTTTFLALILAFAFALAGVLVVAVSQPHHVHYSCAADRRDLTIAIESYRERYGASTEPTRADLKHEGLIDTVDKAYTFTYLRGVPQFEPLTGTGCK